MDEDEDVVRELEELEKLPYDLYLDDVDESFVDWPPPRGVKGSYSRRGRGGRSRRPRGGRINRGDRFIEEKDADMFDLEAGGDSKWDMEKESATNNEDYGSGYGNSSRGGHRGPPGFKPFGRAADDNSSEDRAAGEEYPERVSYPSTRGGHRGPPGFKPFGRSDEEYSGRGYERSWSKEEDGGSGALPSFAPHRKDPRLAGKHGRAGKFVLLL